MAISIVVEWDNARLSEQWRSRALLTELASQILAIGEKFEVIVVFDRSDVEQAALESLLVESGLAEVPNASTSCHGFDHLRYFDLKNAGSDLSSGEIIVFIDSDVIPQGGWLSEILRLFENPAVGLIGGNTFVGPLRNLYSRTYALCCYFDLPDEPLAPSETVKFFFNNFAMRRQVHLDHRFLNDPEKYRTQADDYRDHLREHRIGAWSLPAAQVMHPPPNGLFHLFARSLLEGHDSYLDARRLGHEDAFNRSLRFLAWDLLRCMKRLVLHRKRVWLSLVEVIPAALLTTAVCFTRWLGFVLTHLFPQRLKLMAKSV